jgi:hypothetical protein
MRLLGDVGLRRDQEHGGGPEALEVGPPAAA